MRASNPILIAVTLLAVEPTDRALSGWMPFSEYLLERRYSEDSEDLMDRLTGGGAT